MATVGFCIVEQKHTNILDNVVLMSRLATVFAAIFAPDIGGHLDHNMILLGDQVNREL